MNKRTKENNVSHLLALSATGKRPYVSPDIEVYPFQQDRLLLVQSEIRPTPGPSVENNTEEEEDLEFE